MIMGKLALNMLGSNCTAYLKHFMNMMSGRTFAVICLPAKIFCIEYFLQSCNELSCPLDIFPIQIMATEFLN